MTRAEMLVAAVRARGCDAEDVRDAAHEAYHALDMGVPHGKWDRETIHRAICRKRRRALETELMARAVEQIVCADLGVKLSHPLASWAFTTFMEAFKQGPVAFPLSFDIEGAIRKRMKTPEARAAANAVLALADQTEV